jgi:tetratricopeptide (TPR) repeat protein
MHRLRSVAFLLLVAVAVAATARFALEREASEAGRVRNPAWLPNGRALRIASFGHRLLLSDFYWLKSVQYVGETVLARTDRWEALLPLVDLATDLDPRHGYAYQVTGSNLAGLAGRHAEAAAILQKGIRNLPERWGLYWVHAVNKFLYEGEFAEAAAYARKAAEVGKRPHLALLASSLSLVANTEDEYQATIAVLAEMLEQTDVPELRDELERRLVKVSTYLVLSRLERAVEEYRARHGRPPPSLAALLGPSLPELPRDPAGGRIVYDADTGEVRSTVLGKRAPLRPDAPGPAELRLP